MSDPKPTPEDYNAAVTRMFEKLRVQGLSLERQILGIPKKPDRPFAVMGIGQWLTKEGDK